MREDVAGALGAGEQVLAVVGVEKFAERLDAADHHQQIVLASEREHGIDEIVPRALLAELDFQAVGEEGQEIKRIANFIDCLPAHRTQLSSRPKSLASSTLVDIALSDVASNDIGRARNP